MLKARKWVLIGDDKQFLPIFRTVKNNELLRRLSSFCFFMNRFKDSSRLLTGHYRCNPEIIGFSNRHIYGGMITVHPSCSGIVLNVKGELLPDYLRPDKPTLFIDVESEESLEGRSRFNSLETDAVTKILRDLIEAGVTPSSVGVIAPYTAQVKSIKASLPRRGFDVNTVDSYQGGEKDVIVYSATSTRDMGFVEDLNRVNVAITRARKKLIVVGNGTSLGKHGGLLSSFMEEADQSQCFYTYVEGVIERKLVIPTPCLGTSDGNRTDGS